MKEIILKEFTEDIKTKLSEGTLKFVGFCSEEAIKLNKGKKYIFIITKTQDILSEVLGTPKQNVYVYKEVKQND